MTLTAPKPMCVLMDVRKVRRGKCDPWETRKAEIQPVVPDQARMVRLTLPGERTRVLVPMTTPAQVVSPKTGRVFRCVPRTR